MMLAKQTYAEIHLRLKDRPSAELVNLLDERSVKVGDTAASLLSIRDERKMILNAILSGTLRTRNGKVRALNFLGQRGRGMPEAIEGYLRLIHDEHPDVVGCALFGLVHWNEARNIDAIRTVRNPRALGLVQKAIAALEASDPTIYSPSFFNQGGVWSQPAGISRERSLPRRT